MCQAGGRLPQAKYQYYSYPFAETLNYAAVAVFKLKPNSEQRYLRAFDQSDLVYMSPIKRERENAGRCQLKEGETYVIVASTEQANTLAEFYLSLYVNQPLRDVEIKRIFHPEDRNENGDEVLPFFIPEEAEKISNRAPAWKINLVKESIKYMMTDEDLGAEADSDQ